MKNYIDGCLIAILYIILSLIVIGYDKLILLILILIGSIYIFILPYKNNKSLYILFIDKYINKL